MTTLLEKNKVVIQPWHSDLEKKIIETTVSIDYLIKWIDKRIWKDKNTPPAIPIKGIGNKVLVLQSATGSGKSTIIPPYLYNKYNEEHGGRGILVTQPKIITTQSIPFDIVHYNKNLKLGDNIGYQTGTLTKKNNRGILFCTVGILLQFLKTLNDKQFLNKYRFIIIDEVHDRSSDLEIVLFYIKQLLTRMWKDSECPFVILMSGTLQPEALMNYFECPRENYIEVRGASFPIQDEFTKYDVPDYLNYIMSKIAEIHINNISDITEDKSTSITYSANNNTTEKSTNELKERKKKSNIKDNDIELISLSYDDMVKDNTNIKEKVEKPKLIDGSFIIDESQEIDVQPDISKNQLHVNNFNIKNTFEPIQEIQKQVNYSVRDIIVFVQGRAQITEIENKIHKLNTELFSKGYTYAKNVINNINTNENEKKNKANKNEKPDNTKYYLLPISLMSENIKQASKEYMNIFTDISNIDVEIYNIDNNGKPGEVIEKHKVSRRVIIATNSAETGLTIESLKYCIDSGFVKELMFCPTHGCMTLINKNIAKNSSTQRRGRVGRKAPGIFYPMYTKETFDYMPVFTFPEIVKEDITMVLLELIIKLTETQIHEIDVTEKNIYETISRNDASFNQFQKLDRNKLYHKSKIEKDFKELYFQTYKFSQQWYKLVNGDVFEAQNLDFIQYPSSDSMSYSLEKLHVLGFIDHEFKPTIYALLGIKFRKIKLDNIKMILAGYYYGANILDLITIACCVQEKNNIGIRRNKYKPRNPLNLSEKECQYYYKLVFADEFIEYLFIWNDFMNIINNIGELLNKKSTNINEIILPSNYLTHWCEANSFKLQGLLYVIELRDEIINDMVTIGLNPYYNSLEIPRGKYNLVNILNKNLSEGIEEIKKIKNCIYEGYKMNYCIWDSNINKYISPIFHLPLTISNILINPLIPTDKIKDDIQTRPKHIVVSEFVCREVFMSKNNSYELTCGDISVLDNYVDIDVAFYQN